MLPSSLSLQDSYASYLTSQPCFLLAFQCSGGLLHGFRRRSRPFLGGNSPCSPTGQHLLCDIDWAGISADPASPAYYSGNFKRMMVEFGRIPGVESWSWSCSHFRTRSPPKGDFLRISFPAALHHIIALTHVVVVEFACILV